MIRYNRKTKQFEEHTPEIITKVIIEEIYKETGRIPTIEMGDHIIFNDEEQQPTEMQKSRIKLALDNK